MVIFNSYVKLPEGISTPVGSHSPLQASRMAGSLRMIQNGRFEATNIEGLSTMRRFLATNTGSCLWFKLPSGKLT